MKHTEVLELIYRSIYTTYGDDPPGQPRKLAKEILDFLEKSGVLFSYKLINLNEIIEALEIAKEAQWDTLCELTSLANDGGWSDQDAVIKHNRVGYETVTKTLNKIQKSLKENKQYD